METIESLRKLAMSFPESTEEPHFEKTSFRVKKKIFATYDQKLNRASIKLTLIDQDVFTKGSAGAIFPVDNKWGQQGWTIIQLENVQHDLFIDAITTAYCEVAPKKLSELIRSQNED